MTLHICIFTTAHPLDDVRVKSKFVDSFLAAGARVTWIGPERTLFHDGDPRDPRVSYRLIPSRGGWIERITLFKKLRHTLQGIGDADWVYTPDPDAAALALSARTPARVLFDIHEEFHKGQLVNSLPGPLRHVAQQAVQAVIAGIAQRTNVTVAVNQAVLEAYRAPENRSMIAFNTPPAWFNRPPMTSRTCDSAPLTLFHGKASSNNGTREILAALKLLRERGRTARVIMIPRTGIGEPYDPTFDDAVITAGVQDFLQLGPGLPHREMPNLMSQAQVGLISYDRKLGPGSLPNRFFEYMALGIPVIVPNYSPLMRRIVEQEAIGYTADFEDPSSIATAIETAMGRTAELEYMGSNARRAFEEKYAWNPIFDQLLNLLGT